MHAVCVCLVCLSVCVSGWGSAWESGACRDENMVAGIITHLTCVLGTECRARALLSHQLLSHLSAPELLLKLFLPEYARSYL